MENTKIEWATHTFNPWMGCTKVSPGCANCYAETLMAVRYGKVQWGKGKPRVKTGPENWRKPRLWNKQAEATVATIEADIGNFSEYQSSDYERPRVFCASLADVFDEEVPDAWRAELFQLIDDCKNLDWLLLTKRPENITRLMQRTGVKGHLFGEAWTFADSMPNVWIGTSVENQQLAEKRIPELLKIPAAVRFLSCEPLLSQVHLIPHPPQFGSLPALIDGIDWVIVGGESGRGARIMKEQWALSLRDQCQAKGVAFHFKQWGGSDKKAAGRVLDGRTYDELPTPRVLQYS